ncbi:hypothetical protein EUX98_g8657 [Antrodiella citrinella]|uniref:Cytochrome P450 n=1 Tax=Antrodiella citrinella TaxID=2447956 RepID=A0A4S4M4I8_9APHY|nr:hypothetical protein EUX98_g8657 [Antrodiella citrinella]
MIDVPLLYVAASISVLAMLWNWIGPGSLRHIPTVGTTIPILAYLNGLRFIKHAKEMLQEGYDKHATKGGIFKISMPDQWLVLISGPKLIEEVRKLPDNAISLADGVDELIAVRYILGANIVADPFHISLIHAKLQRNLSDFYGIQKEEMWNAFETEVGSYPEWHCVPGLKTMVNIIARTSNRVFVGLPLCRDPTFLSIATSFTMDVSKSRFIINLFPSYLKAPVARLINKVPAAVQRAYEVNDLLMWLIEIGMKKGLPNKTIAQYLLVVEFTALHTTAMSFTHALYYLAADPSLMAPLREEVDAAVASEGGDWGKGVVNKLHKIDSFLRESQRLNGINATTVWRKTLKPVTFSNGVTLPTGTFFSAAAAPTHTDAQHYVNPNTFDPWRFVNTKSESTSQTFVSTSVDYIPFGHGRHACPGRHFASYQMKLMLAYIVTYYDVSFEPGKEGKRPETKWFGNTIIPDPTVNVMFRKRRS